LNFLKELNQQAQKIGGIYSEIVQISRDVLRGAELETIGPERRQRICDLAADFPVGWTSKHFLDGVSFPGII